jgi:hypothetical protein
MNETNRSHDRANSQKGRSEPAEADKGKRANAPDSAPPVTPSARNKYHDRPADDGAGQHTGHDRGDAPTGK